MKCTEFTRWSLFLSIKSWKFWRYEETHLTKSRIYFYPI